MGYATLGRVRISLAAAGSAMVARLLASYHMGSGILVTGLGVFLLACGASGLNQYQERETDRLMDRTKKRPLPAGTLTIAEALAFIAACSMVGLVCLYLSGGIFGTAAGLFALLWYNGLYTGLKRKTAFAAVPGALVGAIPPAIGWHAAGGGLSDPGLYVLCLFFFLWQVPHFWLFAMQFGEQYRQAGLPAVTTVFSERQLARIVFIWTASAAVGPLLFVPFGLTLHGPVGYLLAAASLGLVLQAGRLLGRGRFTSSGRSLLSGINVYLVVVMALLFADRVI